MSYHSIHTLGKLPLRRTATAATAAAASSGYYYQWYYSGYYQWQFLLLWMFIPIDPWPLIQCYNYR